MKRAVLVSIVLFAVALSGCTGGGQSYSDIEGIRINEFSADFSRISDYQEPVTLYLEIENVGAKTLPKDGHWWIYNVKFGGTGGWQVSGQTEGVIDHQNFYPPQEGMRGAVDSFMVTLTPPNLPENMEDTYTFKARVCYPYRTTTNILLESVSLEERRFATLRKKEVTPTEAEARNSAGPIKIDIDSSKQITPRQGSLTLFFKITDAYAAASQAGVGDLPFSTAMGSCPSDPNVPQQDRGKVKVTVTVDGQPCNPTTGSNEVMLRDGTGTFICEVTGINTDDPTHEYHVIAAAEYEYWVTRSVKVTVEDSLSDTDSL